MKQICSFFPLSGKASTKIQKQISSMKTLTALLFTLYFFFWDHKRFNFLATTTKNWGLGILGTTALTSLAETAPKLLFSGVGWCANLQKLRKLNEAKERLEKINKNGEFALALKSTEKDIAELTTQLNPLELLRAVVINADLACIGNAVRKAIIDPKDPEPPRYFAAASMLSAIAAWIKLVNQCMSKTTSCTPGMKKYVNNPGLLSMVIDTLSALVKTAYSGAVSPGLLSLQNLDPDNSFKPKPGTYDPFPTFKAAAIIATVDWCLELAKIPVIVLEDLWDQACDSTCMKKKGEESGNDSEKTHLLSSFSLV